jgi:hypothetical protein
MAGTVLDAPGLDEQRAELRAVLESEEFRRAPTLTRLLSYLCEKVFAGEAASIKEYSVGVEVFARAASFDQDSDSIVRVEANRLRKRLADYYAGPGASHRLRISIPIGQYVPRLEERSDSQTALSDKSPTASPDRVPDQTVPANRNHLVVGIGPPAWLSAMIAIALVAVAWAAWFALRHGSHSTVVSSPDLRFVSQPAPQLGLPVGDEVRILAGGNRSLVDHAGKLWAADAWFAGGESVHSSVLQIWRTEESSFYRNSRQGQFRYDIPLKEGVYELHLHFAETAYGPELSSAGGEGSRLITIRANQQTLLSGLDVVADAGASRTADVKVFPGIQPAADGKLHLEFVGEQGTQAMVSAIEILPAAPNHARPIRVLARPSPYYSNDSRWWSPDEYFQGGQLSSYVAPVSGTDDPELFESERWGNFSYAIPVAPGKYAVTLLFAIHRAHLDDIPAPSQKDAPHSSRVFNVYCNGRVLLQDFDLAKAAHPFDVVIRRFTGLIPNAQGKLFFAFVPVAGYAAVSGIEVVSE